MAAQKKRAEADEQARKDAEVRELEKKLAEVKELNRQAAEGKTVFAPGGAPPQSDSIERNHNEDVMPQQSGNN